MRSRAALAVGLAALAVASLVTVGAPAASGQAPQGARQRYLVVLDEAADPPRDGLLGLVDGLLGRLGAEVDQLFTSALNGFTAMLTPDQAARLEADGQVRSVEVDQLVEAAAQSTPAGVSRVVNPAVPSASVPNLGINGRDDARVNADIAVIDTGIASHPDLNVVARTDCVRRFGPCRNGAGGDGNGHGTHVAGSAAAIDNAYGVVGVAPGARLWSVRALGANGVGYLSDVVAGLDWVAARASRIEVANLSLSCRDCPSVALNAAVTGAVNAGVVVVAAAGNGGSDARRYSPANHPDVIAVSAMADFDGYAGGRAGSRCGEADDTLAGFSNRGAVDVAAPGVCVISTVPGGYERISGTSMAAGYVSGAAALLAARRNPDGRSAALAIRDTIVGTGNQGWVDDGGDGVREPLLDVSSPAYTVAGAR